MTTLIVWPARRVGDRILCGRPPPPSGGCRGEIALVGRYDDVGEYAFIGSGMAEDPPGSNHWRRTKSHRGAGVQRLTLHMLGSGARSAVIPPMPLWVRCPTCGDEAEVTADLLARGKMPSS